MYRRDVNKFTVDIENMTHFSYYFDISIVYKHHIFKTQEMVTTGCYVLKRIQPVNISAMRSRIKTSRFLTLYPKQITFVSL